MSSWTSWSYGWVLVGGLWDHVGSCGIMWSGYSDCGCVLWLWLCFCYEHVPRWWLLYCCFIWYLVLALKPCTAP
jgi:hypothetical protein